MSQHYFEANHDGLPVTVTLGWDRPLRCFFMTIEKHLDETDIEGKDQHESEGFVYSNLKESSAFKNCLNYYKTKLDEFGISVPKSMFEQVETDSMFNVGNRYVWHQPDGSFKE